MTATLTLTDIDMLLNGPPKSVEAQTARSAWHDGMHMLMVRQQAELIARLERPETLLLPIASYCASDGLPPIEAITKWVTDHPEFASLRNDHVHVYDPEPE